MATSGFLNLCRSFGEDVTSWATFNEPGVYTFSGYCMGSFPPGKHFHFGLAGRVMKHMMICHSEAYKLIKGLPGKPQLFLQCRQRHHVADTLPSCSTGLHHKRWIHI